MTDPLTVYRRKTMRTENWITVALYQPPLNRLTFMELDRVARLASAEAEVCEAVFPSGRRVLLAFRPGGEDGPDYTPVEPGEHLSYSHATGSLCSTDDDDLARWYEKVAEGETDG